MASIPEPLSPSEVVSIFELGRRIGANDVDRHGQRRYWVGFADGVEEALAAPISKRPGRIHRASVTRTRRVGGVR